MQTKHIFIKMNGFVQNDIDSCNQSNGVSGEDCMAYMCKYVSNLILCYECFRVACQLLSTVVVHRRWLFLFHGPLHLKKYCMYEVYSILSVFTLFHRKHVDLGQVTFLICSGYGCFNIRQSLFVEKNSNKEQLESLNLLSICITNVPQRHSLYPETLFCIAHHLLVTTM